MTVGAETTTLDDLKDLKDNEIEIEMDEGEGGGDATTQTQPEQPRANGDGRVSNSAIEAGGDDEETPEQRRERRRRESQQRRQNQKQFAQEDHQVIAALTHALQTTQEQVKQLGGKLEELDTEKVINARNHWVRTAKKLRAAYSRAHEDGATGDQLLDLQDEYNAAVRNAHHFNNMVQERQNGGGRPQETQEQRQPQQRPQAQPQQVQGDDDEPPEVKTAKRNGQIFQAKHDWYDPDPNTQDRDTLLVRKLDKEVFDSGLRPNQKAYWDKLEEKMRAQGLIDDGDTGTQPRQQDQPRDPTTGKFAPKNTAGGPPVGGRTTPSGKKVVAIPEHLEKVIKQAGLWNNQEAKKKIVKEYYRKLEQK